MTTMNDPVPMLVPVPVQGSRHFVYAALQADVEAYGEAVYATTLCGLPCGRDLVMRRAEARKLPDECSACRIEDERRYPDGFSRRLLR